MQRRDLMAGLSASLLGWQMLQPVAASDNMPASADAIKQQLTRGGCAVLLRHAQTESGVGDPPGFTLDVCSSQRNLNAAGQQQSRQIGLWFSQHGFQPSAIRSSAWCRCQDTARLAFGNRFTVWPALNSFFGDSRAQEPAQTAELRTALAQLPQGSFEVWVTHQVNITAVTGDVPSMGEARIVRLQVQGKIQHFPLRFI